MIKLYAKFVEEQLNIKVIVGKKTAHERFAGALATYTIETMMQDGQALQAGTSHYFGQVFAKVFNIKFSNHENQQEFGYQTSWGVSTRLIGALIMAHSDDLGLVLPPTLAPIQIMILNLAPKNSEITKLVKTIFTILEPYFRVAINDDDKSFSFKKSESQIKGIPLTIEIGEKEWQQAIIKLVLRHNLTTIFCNINDEQLLIKQIKTAFTEISTNLLDSSQKNFANNLQKIVNFNDYQKLVKTHKGYFIAPFCGDIKCEAQIKTLTRTTSRCIPLVAVDNPTSCFKCQQPDSPWTYFARSY